MNFEYTDEQSILKETVGRLIGDTYDVAHRRKMIGSERGYDPALWSRFAELGLLGLPFAEADGGFEGGAVEKMIVMEALGRGPAVEPYLASVVLAGGTLHRAGIGAQRAHIGQIVSGELVAAFAHDEDGGRYRLSRVTTRARRDAGGWVLSGRKVGVLAGDAAGLLIVSARTEGSDTDEAGISLFLVPAQTAGLRVEGYANYDGVRAALVDLDDVRLPDEALLGQPGQAYALIEEIHDQAIAAICAEAVGAMDAMLAATVDYIKTRNQFGGPIGRFQSLQHRCAEMYVMLEQARSMAIYAAMSADLADRDSRRRAISAAKIQICESARFVGQQTVQLHGGIGVTDEVLVSHHFRRTTVIERQFGDIDHHIYELDRLGGLYGAA